MCAMVTSARYLAIATYHNLCYRVQVFNSSPVFMDRGGRG